MVGSARRLAAALPAAALLLNGIATTAAADAPWVNDPQGPIAREVSSLYWIFFAMAVVVLVLVDGGLIYAGIKFRERPGHTARQFHSHNLLEIGWTVIPTMMVLAMTFLAIGKVNFINDTSNAEMVVHVEGRQWAWLYTYPNQPAFLTRESKPLQAAQELHIPVNTKVKLELSAPDVIHSFFVPSLGGKKDAVPGRQTALWIQADKPGVFKGQCSEFCGQGHADMLITIVAHPKAEYAAWARGAVEEWNKLNDPAVAQYRQVFLAQACAGCHMVRGTTAQGKVGPELTAIWSRPTIAGVLPMNEANMKRWLQNPPAVKPGTQMPALGLSDQVIDDIVRYLVTLR